MTAAESVDAYSRADEVRSVLRDHAKGVAVITAGPVSTAPVGFCATSFASLSLDPPLMAFAVGLRAASRQTVEAAPCVAIHLLCDTQEELARRFADTNAPKFGPRTRWHRGFLGLPILDDVLAWLALEPTTRVAAGDHLLVVGRVIAACHVAAGSPLIHHDGRFTRLA